MSVTTPATSCEAPRVITMQSYYIKPVLPRDFVEFFGIRVEFISIVDRNCRPGFQICR